MFLRYIATFFLSSILLFSASSALATSTLNLGFGEGGLASKAADTAGYDAQGTTNTTLATTIGMVIQFALSFLGILFTLLMVYAGYVWMTARGDEGKVETAQGIIRTAVIGLIIILASYNITNFVVNYYLKKGG